MRWRKVVAKLPHILLDGYCYFVTTTIHERKPIFHDRENAHMLSQTIYNQRRKGRFYLLGFVIMPEHFHLMIVPQNKTKVSFIMQEIKKGSARLINQRSSKKGKIWMDEYYESAVRSEKDFWQRIDYMRNNPAKRGLVEKAEDYPFSSANKNHETDLERFLSGSGTTLSPEIGLGSDF